MHEYKALHPSAAFWFRNFYFLASFYVFRRKFQLGVANYTHLIPSNIFKGYKLIVYLKFGQR